MRRHILAGNSTIFGEEFGTLIYGAGKRVISSFQQFALSAEPYILDENNEFVYFGDLDYEGIGIYENLATCFQEQAKLKPFVAAYAKMLTKSRELPQLPTTKEGQNRQLEGFFFNYFEFLIIKFFTHNNINRSISCKVLNKQSNFNICFILRNS